MTIKRSKSPVKTVGSRAQVMHGTAHHTSSGLTSSDLMYNRHGRIVSKLKYQQGKRLYKEYKDVLQEHQFQKGEGGRKRRSRSGSKRKSRSRR